MSHAVLGKNSGAEGQNRTADTSLFRAVLCQLSYLGTRQDVARRDDENRRSRWLKRVRRHGVTGFHKKNQGDGQGKKQDPAQKASTRSTVAFVQSVTGVGPRRHKDVFKDFRLNGRVTTVKASGAGSASRCCSSPAFALYLASTPRTVMLEDDGLFISAAAHVAGVPHPPGYPLLRHTLAGWPHTSRSARLRGAYTR